jgi:NhaP-type Na+/H+ and K+/H+ antiporter
VTQPLTVPYLVFIALGAVALAGLSGLFLATTLRQPSHALSGAALFVLFASGAASQLATARLQASRVLALGTVSVLAGLLLLVVSVRLPTPHLALFLIGGALIGAGSGAVFKGTTGIVLEASPAESRVAMTSDLLIARVADELPG